MKDYLGKGVISLVRGLIRGMGREAVCELLARKRPLGGVDEFGIRRYDYSQFSIVRAPADFPDGAYTVTTDDGQELAVIKTQALWMIQEPQAPAGETPRECA